MPRGLSAGIKVELGKTNLALPVYCVRITLSASNILRYADRQVSFDDGTGVKTYTARLQGLSGLEFSIDQAAPIQAQLVNADNVITALDQAESFQGALCEVIAYLPGTGDYYLLWSGWCDEFAEIGYDLATLPAYPTVSTPNVQIPKTVLGPACGNTFGNFANWTNARDNDGSACPYGMTSSRGFAATLIGAMNAVTNPITFSVSWGATPAGAGAKFAVGDYLNIGRAVGSATGGEIMLLTAAGAVDGSFNQSVTCTRAQKGTALATHANGDRVSFQNCTYASDGCTRRGMYGNNPSDTYTIPTYGGTAKRNYYGGFPYLIGYQYGNYKSQAGERTHPLRLVFSGNSGANGRALPIVYGRARVADPVLLIAKPEGDFLTTLWAVSEGLLATNAANDAQAGVGTRNKAYSATTTAAGNRLENIYVNGKSRHDSRPGYGIEVQNGDQDEGEPAPVFFPTDPPDFVNNFFAYWGTARVAFRISTKDNPSVDVTGQSVTGSFEVQYGRVHRVYSDTVTFVRRATDDGSTPGASPAWVIMDLLASKRGGAGLDHARLNIQSFIDAASYCSTTVTDTFFGGNVKRWTFNGVIDQRKALSQWMHDLCLSFYCLEPYLDGNGKIKIRMLKSESLSGLPLFSSKVASATARNIIWDGPHSSLTKSRKPITELPNEVRVNFVDKSHDPGFSATLNANVNGTTDPVNISIHWGAAAIAAGIQFRLNDKVVIDSEIMWITVAPAAPDGSNNQSIHCQRAYNSSTKAAHAGGGIVQFWGIAYGKISVTVADRDAQTSFGASLGDQSLRVLSKVVDLPGVTTYDEAARIATLILRAGEFGQGGQANNLQITFKAFHRDCEDLEIGDIIQLEDDLLDATTEAYFRVLRMTLQPVQLPGGGIDFARQITAALHSNAIYDDTALTVPQFSRSEAAGGYDVAPDPVGNFAITETGIYDGNNKPTSTMQFNYDVPSPLGNFGSLLIYRSTDDGSGSGGSTANYGAPVGDWRYVAEVFSSGQTVQYPVQNPPVYEWFSAVSRPLSGHTPDINAQNPDGITPRYPQVPIKVDGIQDVLPAPSTPGTPIAVTDVDIVTLTWAPYTGDNLKLFKHFRIYRNTVNSGPPSIGGTATLIASLDGTVFSDTTPSLLSSTTYYYWIVGLSILDAEGSVTSTLSTMSPDPASSVAQTSTLVNHAIVLGSGSAQVKPGTLGTTTTVLHGNAAGDPSYAAVSLTADVSGTLALANGGLAATTAAGGRATIGAAAAGTPGAHTIPVAKITGGGADGSITWNADGVVTSYVDPT